MKPDAKLTPRDWQQADIDKIANSLTEDVGALVVSAPGAGKTLVAVEALRAKNPKTVLIVAPPSTHGSAWERTLVRQGVTLPMTRLVGAGATEKLKALEKGVPGVYITSAQWFTRQKWGKIHPDMVIIDEVHMLGKYGNKGQRALNGYANSKGLVSKWRLALSGTPWRNNFENAWAVVRWVEPDKVNPVYWAWRASECVGVYDHFAPQNLRVTGERVPGKLASSMTCLISHSQRGHCCDYHPNGFLADLPEPVRIERDLDMTRAQSSFYHSMEKTYFALLTSPNPETGIVPVVAELPIVARGMLRFCALALPSFDEEGERLYFSPDAESPKIDQLIQDLAALDGKRVLVLTHSAQFAKLVEERVGDAGYSIVAWTGALTQRKRDRALKDFREGELDVIVGVIAAMGTGTDGLQEAAYNAIFVSVDDDSSNNTQGVARLDRLGQTHQVTIMEYRMKNTFDVGHLSRQIALQLELNKTILNGGGK